MKKPILRFGVYGTHDPLRNFKLMKRFAILPPA